MMHPYSPSPRWLAVPGIGFPQNIPVGPKVLDLEALRDRSTAIWFTQRHRTDDHRGAPTQLIDRIARPSFAVAWAIAAS